MTKKDKIYVAIAVTVFCAVFAALLAIATIYDWEISKIMTKNALPEGEYFSTSGFGLFFESIGSAPIYLMTAIAGAILVRYASTRKDKTALRIIAAVAGVVLIFAMLFLFVKDLFKYVGEHHGVEMSEFYVVCLVAAVTVILSVLLVLAWKNVGEETNDKLLKFAFVIIGMLVCYLIVSLVKSPMGRMRYRTINYSPEYDESAFSRWYVPSGKRNVVSEAGGVSIDDSCKSFPSGHTYSAAIIYAVLCLPDLLENFDKKWVKAILWLCSIGYTGTVAVSRIVVGAHYMSDVLFGGTISFLAMVLLREIFICKGFHLGIGRKMKIAEQPLPFEGLTEKLPAEKTGDEPSEDPEDEPSAGNGKPAEPSEGKGPAGKKPAAVGNPASALTDNQ